MRRAHILGRNHTTDLPQHFIVVDTETLPEASPLGQTIHKLNFGMAIYFTMPVGRKKKPRRELFKFTQASSFWEWLNSKLTSKVRMVVSAHNLAFDFLVLRGMEFLPLYDFKIGYPILGGTRFITKAKRKNNSLWFIDSMNYIPTSLAAIGQSLGLAKLDMPAPSAPQSEWDTYCERDVTILEMFWRSLIDFYREHDLGAFASTAASMAFNAFRHKHMHYPIYIHNQPDSCERERESYYGGRCECFRLGLQAAQPYTMLDVNSMYPFVMHERTYPVKLCFNRQAPPLSKFESIMAGYQCVATVGLDTDLPMYPTRRNDKLIFPIGRFQTTLADPELREAMQRGHIQYVKHLIAYDHEPIFQTYIEEFYNLRLAYRSEGKEAFALFTKLLCNSLYGKWGQRGHEREALPNLKEILFGHETIFSSKAQRFMNVYYWFGEGWIEKEEGESFNSFPAISACVTSAARLYLWELIEQAGYSNVYYCDTDSLVVNQTGLQRVASCMHPRELGKLKLEKESERLLLRGPKDYAFGNKEKTKGVSAKAVRLNDNLYEQIHFATFKESIRAGISDGVLLTNVQKHLTRKYEKGNVSQEGLVSPFFLSEF